MRHLLTCLSVLLALHNPIVIRADYDTFPVKSINVAKAPSIDFYSGYSGEVRALRSSTGPTDTASCPSPHAFLPVCTPHTQHNNIT